VSDTTALARGTIFLLRINRDAMNSEQLAAYAKLVEGPGNCGEHRDAIEALLGYVHDLECKVEILSVPMKELHEKYCAILCALCRMGDPVKFSKEWKTVGPTRELRGWFHDRPSGPAACGAWELREAKQS